MEHYGLLGVVDVIVKPFDPMTLSERIDHIWQRYRKDGHVHTG